MRKRKPSPSGKTVPAPGQARAPGTPDSAVDEAATAGAAQPASEALTPVQPAGVPVGETPDNLKAREAAFKKRHGRTPPKR